MSVMRRREAASIGVELKRPAMPHMSNSGQPRPGSGEETQVDVEEIQERVAHGNRDQQAADIAAGREHHQYQARADERQNLPSGTDAGIVGSFDGPAEGRSDKAHPQRRQEDLKV